MPTATKTKEVEKKRSLLDALEAGEKADGGGGGGIIGKVLPEIGWKIFVQGLSNAESFFAFDPFDEDSKEEAKQSAKQSLPAGSTSRVQTAVQFTVFKNSVKGREVTWQGDRVFTTPQWTEAYKQVIKPAIHVLAEAGQEFSFGEECWMRLGFKADPSGKMKANYKFDANQPVSAANPETVTDLVAYPAQIFADEAEAEAGTPATEFSNGNGNGDYLAAVQGDKELFGDFTKALKTAAKGKVGKLQEKALLAVAKEYVSPDDEYNTSILDELKTLAK